MLARTAFKNPDFQKQIEADGFFTTPLLGKDQVEECNRLYYDTQASLDDKFYNTLASPDLEYRRKVQHGLDKILNKKIKEFFYEYEPLAYNFAAKSSGEGSECKLHCDDIHADESIHLCVNIWIPLVDVDDGNGSLQILPKSHTLPPHIRGIGLPFAYEHLTALIAPQMYTLKMKAGEALFFNPQLIHGSEINKTDSDRPAIILAMLPAEAQPLTYVRTTKVGKAMVTLFETPTAFFLESFIGEIPQGFKTLKSFEYEPLKISAEEFTEIMKRT